MKKLSFDKITNVIKIKFPDTQKQIESAQRQFASAFKKALLKPKKSVSVITARPGKKSTYHKTYYLIDFENVNEVGLAGCEQLKSTDYIHLFYTDHTRKINLDLCANHGNARLFLHKAPAGKQSLDMHLVSYLGYLIGRNHGRSYSYIIISKDTDYDNLIKFWKEKYHVRVSRKARISSDNMTNETDTKAKQADKAKQTAAKTKQTAAKTKQTAKPKQTAANTNQTTAKPKQTSANANQTAAQTKQTTKSTGNKSSLYGEVHQLINKAYNQQTANTVATMVVKSYGDKQILTKVHNELQNAYPDEYLDLYALIKPIITKAAPTALEQPSGGQANTALNMEIQKILANAKMESSIINDVASIVVKNAAQKNGKQTIYRTIISKYGQKQGLEIYNHIKKHI